MIEVWFLTQGSLLCGDDNFGWVVVLDIWYLCRGPSFVGMTIMGVVVFGMGDWVLTQGSLLRRDDNFGWLLWSEVVGTYAEVPPSSG